jgi:peptidoglycan/LPS O-acetylase OafA/YrhL
MSDQAAKLAEESSRERFVFVDALRGIAALMVLSHHLLFNPMLEASLRRILPSMFCSICTLGSHGVEIFFIISGFVIAHSMRNVAPTAAGAGRFILRRQLRLDPPYWAMIFLAILDLALENHVPFFIHKPIPTPGQLFLNLFYLQFILHSPQIVTVSWTLCLEIQFYLCFILICLIGRLEPDRRGGVARPSIVTLFALGLVSLVWTTHQRIYAPWFVPFWSYFAAGVLCYWNYRRLIPKRVFLCFLVAFAIATCWTTDTGMIVGCVTVVLLSITGEAGQLSHWLSNGILQYFGRISYSLYLVHLLVVSAILRGGYKLTHENRFGALCWFIVAAAAAIFAAHWFHKLIEVPSLRGAALLRGQRPKSPTTRPHAAPARDRVHPEPQMAMSA